MLILGLEFQYFSRNHQYFISTDKSVYLEALGGGGGGEREKEVMTTASTQRMHNNNIRSYTADQIL